MTNTELQFTRTFEFDEDHWNGGYRATDPAEDGSFWLHCEGFDFAFRVTPKVENFQLSLDQVTNHPETWNQMAWFSELPEGAEAISAAPECGTAACLAGTIALQHGARFEDKAARVFTIIAPEWYSQSVHGTVPVTTFAIDMLFEVHPDPVFMDAVSDDPDDDTLKYEREALLRGLWNADNTLFELWDLGQFLTNSALIQPSDEVIAAAQEKSAEIFDRH